MCQVCEALRSEKAQVRPIPVDEALNNEKVFVQRVEEKINEILKKYNCLLHPSLVSDKDGKITGMEINVVLNNHFEIS